MKKYIWQFLSHDEKTRDELLFGDYSPEKYQGGIRRFEGLDADTLSKLIAQRFINPQDYQGSAPDVAAISRFMGEYPAYKASGYAVTVDREDYRISLTGIDKNGTFDSTEEFNTFSNLFKDTNVLSTNPVRCKFV